MPLRAITEDSGVRKKSLNDVRNQLARIVGYYGDNGNARSERAFDIAGQYENNIFSNRRFRAVQNEQGTSAAANVQLSQNAYRGLNAG